MMPRTNTPPPATPATTTSLTELLCQHGGRLAVIFGVLSYCSHAILATSARIGVDEVQMMSYSSVHEMLREHGTTLLLSVLTLYWLIQEVRLIVQQYRYLPPGTVGSLPLIGESIQFLLDPVSYSDAKATKYGDTYIKNALGGISLTIGNPLDISWLWTCERKGLCQVSWPPTIRALLGPGAVANTSGQRHRALRRILEPAFLPGAIRDYVVVMDNVIKESLTDWSGPPTDSSHDDDHNGDDRPFHPSAVFKMFALRLFFVSAFSQIDASDEIIIQQLHDDFTQWIGGFGAVVAIRVPGTAFAKAMDARDRILATVELLIEKFKRANSPASSRGQTSLMGRICYATDAETGEPMALDDLRDNLLNMIFAGHDTTYASMGTVLHYLEKYPTLRTALHEEITTKILNRDADAELDYDALKNAPLLNAFLMECWRVDPPVQGGFRRLNREVSRRDYTIPTGMVVNFNILAATQNETLYPEPKSFHIGRFLPRDHPMVESKLVDGDENQEVVTCTDNSNGDHQVVTMPAVDSANLKAFNYPIFGGGTHACLGSHFAKLELRIFVVRILQCYDLTVRNSTKVVFPVNGWKNEFRLIPRHR